MGVGKVPNENTLFGLLESTAVAPKCRVSKHSWLVLEDQIDYSLSATIDVGPPRVPARDHVLID